MNNITNSSQDCLEQEESWALFYVLMSPIYLTGLVGNGLILIIFIRHQNMRSAPNTLLFNLALSDIINLVFCCTAPAFDLVIHIMPAICSVIRLVWDTAMNGTTLSLLWLSVERYFAIARPFQSRAASATFARRAVILIWVSSVIFSLIKFTLQNPTNCDKCVRMIDPRTLTAKYVVFSFITLYIGPLSTIAVFYILMAHNLYFNVHTLSHPNEASLRQMNTRRSISVWVICLVMVYVIAFFPYHFFSLKLFFFHDLEQARQMAPIMGVLYCIGCIYISFNGFILYFLSKTFRAHFNNYLFCCILNHQEPRSKTERYNNRNETIAKLRF